MGPDPRSFEGIEGDVNVSPARAEWSRRHIGVEARRWLDEDARYFLHQALSTPCLNVLARADGIYLEDVEGRRYMDFHGNSVHQVGFARPAVELAKTLARITPGDLAKSLFCPSGAAAVGMALRLARAATGRHKTISMWDAFHGASLDASSVGGERMFR